MSDEREGPSGTNDDGSYTLSTRLLSVAGVQVTAAEVQHPGASEVRKFVWVTSKGEIFYLPPIDRREDYGIKLNEDGTLPDWITDKENPPNFTPGKRELAKGLTAEDMPAPDYNPKARSIANKVVWTDFEKKVAWCYTPMEKDPVHGYDYTTLVPWYLGDIRPIDDQEIRRQLETRSDHKGFSAQKLDGSTVKYEHKHSQAKQDWDFEKGMFPKDVSKIVDLGPGRGTPMFLYAEDANFRNVVDTWISQKDREYSTDSVAGSPYKDKCGQVELFGGGRAPEGRQYVLFKLAQGCAQDFAKWVKECRQKMESFQRGSIANAPKIPHINTDVRFAPHQAMGLGKVHEQPGMLVGIAAGGGKTLFSLADMLAQLDRGACKRPALGMPDGLLLQQKKEIMRFTGWDPKVPGSKSSVNVIAIDTYVYNKYGKERLRRMITSAPPNTIVLFGYNWLKGESIQTLADAEAGKMGKNYTRAYWLWHDCGVDMVTLDESHLIRTIGSDRSNCLLQLMSAKAIKVRRCMSGTLVSNSLQDIYNQALAVDSSVLGSFDDFADTFGETRNRNKITSYKEGAPKALQQTLNNRIAIQYGRPHWLYLLPQDLRRTFHKVTMTGAQQATYQRILKDEIDKILNPSPADYDGGATGVEFKKALVLRDEWLKWLATPEDEREGDMDELHPMLLARFSVFEQFLGCPLIDKQFARSQGLSKEDKVSPKSAKIDELLTKHFADPTNGKVIVFCRYGQVANHLLNESKFARQGLYYDASREDNLEQFKTDPAIKVLFAVDRSLQEGHNLQFVNRIIRAELPWTPGDVEQSEARAYRRGNKHKTLYFDTILVDNTAEITKCARLISKQHLNTKLLTDYDDNDNYQPVAMNIANMTEECISFDEHLVGHLEAASRIHEFEKKEGERLEKEQGRGEHDLSSKHRELPGSGRVKVPLLDGDEDPMGYDPDAKKKPGAATEKTPDGKAKRRGTLREVDVVLANLAGDVHAIVLCNTEGGIPEMTKMRSPFKCTWQQGYLYKRTKTKEEAKWAFEKMQHVGVPVMVTCKSAFKAALKASKLPEGTKITTRFGNEGAKVLSKGAQVHFAKYNGKSGILFVRESFTDPANATLKACGFEMIPTRGYMMDKEMKDPDQLVEFVTRLMALDLDIKDKETFLEQVEALMPAAKRKVTKLLEA